MAPVSAIRVDQAMAFAEASGVSRADFIRISGSVIDRAPGDTLTVGGLNEIMREALKTIERDSRE